MLIKEKMCMHDFRGNRKYFELSKLGTASSLPGLGPILSTRTICIEIQALDT